MTDAEGVGRTTVEAGHTRALTTVFGPVGVTRQAYRRRGHPNLHPADAALNLPTEKHSHGLRRLTAVEATRGSYAATRDAIGRATGQQLGKRQLEELAVRAAADFDGFYENRQPVAAKDADVLVISADGKGIVMRPDALRPATAKAAADATPKLATRLSRGELCAPAHNSPYALSALIRSSACRFRVAPGEGGARLSPLRIITAG
ncbi:hypothetical protein BH23ACT9_BH23ACT9_20370 [soil metagenome]